MASITTSQGSYFADSPRDGNPGYERHRRQSDLTTNNPVEVTSLSTHVVAEPGLTAGCITNVRLILGAEDRQATVTVSPDYSLGGTDRLDVSFPSIQTKGWNRYTELTLEAKTGMIKDYSCPLNTRLEGNEL